MKSTIFYNNLLILSKYVIYDFGMMLKVEKCIKFDPQKIRDVWQPWTNRSNRTKQESPGMAIETPFSELFKKNLKKN